MPISKQEKKLREAKRKLTNTVGTHGGKREGSGRHKKIRGDKNESNTTHKTTQERSKTT